MSIQRYPNGQSPYVVPAVSSQSYMGQQISGTNYQIQQMSVDCSSDQSFQKTYPITGQRQNTYVNQEAPRQLQQMQNYESKVLDGFVAAHDQSLQARQARMEQRRLVHQETLRDQEQIHQAQIAHRTATHIIQQQQEQERLRSLQQTHRLEQIQGEQQLLAQRERKASDLTQLRVHNLQRFQQQELRRQQEFEQLQKTLAKQREPKGFFESLF